MNCTKIPPKSRFIFTDREGALFSKHERTWPYLKYMDEDERFLIAAVAEVEWRKRADRYSKVATHFQSLFTGATRADRKTTRMKAIYQMAACRRTAEEWRAWGESK